MSGLLGNPILLASGNAAALTAHAGDTANPHAVTAAQAGADPSGTAASAVAAHNAASATHADIRALPVAVARAAFAGSGIVDHVPGVATASGSQLAVTGGALYTPQAKSAHLDGEVLAVPNLSAAPATWTGDAANQTRTDLALLKRTAAGAWSLEIAAGAASMAAAGWTASSTDPGLWTSGADKAIPVALLQRRNAGAFDPVYNPNGSWKYSDGQPWYLTGVTRSAANCFAAPATSASGRPDGLTTALAERDVKSLLMEARRPADLGRILERELHRLAAGEKRGWEASTRALGGAAGVPTTAASGSGALYIGTPAWLFATLADGQEVDVEGRVLVSNANASTTYQAGVVYQARKLGRSTSLGYYVRVHGVSADAKAGMTLSLQLSDRTAAFASTLLHCDILGAPASYPAAWAVTPVLGAPLLVGEAGESLLPADVATGSPVPNCKIFKLSRKVQSLATMLVIADGVRFTYDNSVSGVQSTPQRFGGSSTYSTNNQLLINWTGLTDASVVQVFYETPATPLTPEVSAEVLALGPAMALGRGEITRGGALAAQLTGRVPVGAADPGEQVLGRPTGHAQDSGRKLRSEAAYKPVTALVSLAAGTPAVKALPYLTASGGKLALQLLFKELRHDGADWGDDGKLVVADNLAVILDDNAASVLCGQKRAELHWFWKE